MKKKCLAVSLLAAATSFGPSIAMAADLPVYRAPPDARGGVRIGMLHCLIGGGVGYLLGSAKEVDCVFHSSRGGRTDHYTGWIRKLGVDVGFTTESRLVWAVFAPTAGYHRGSLSGLYRGATVEATVGAGVGANALVGGSEHSITLQPLSVGAQQGFDLAVTASGLELEPVR